MEERACCYKIPDYHVYVIVYVCVCVYVGEESHGREITACFDTLII